MVKLEVFVTTTVMMTVPVVMVTGGCGWAVSVVTMGCWWWQQHMVVLSDSSDDGGDSGGNRVTEVWLMRTAVVALGQNTGMSHR